ncbi:hypothetical protein CEXT_473631 [Caerostris extrusa]|uniref:Uncharacterized protein n=1 Tax=Caerostris extrusa TaxID=172846 RepID=A0AAV4RPX0_CAEEX|nr:hypothetical protein CEXT_473631 [Caerostris extrusa]
MPRPGFESEDYSTKGLSARQLAIRRPEEEDNLGCGYLKKKKRSRKQNIEEKEKKEKKSKQEKRTPRGWAARKTDRPDWPAAVKAFGNQLCSLSPNQFYSGGSIPTTPKKAPKGIPSPEGRPPPYTLHHDFNTEILSGHPFDDLCTSSIPPSAQWEGILSYSFKVAIPDLAKDLKVIKGIRGKSLSH